MKKLRLQISESSFSTKGILTNHQLKRGIMRHFCGQDHIIYCSIREPKLFLGYLHLPPKFRSNLSRKLSQLTINCGTVDEEHAIQTDLFVYTRFHTRNIPSDSEETSLQTYTDVLSLEVKTVEIFTARKRSLGQGNIFSSMCQEFCSGRGSTWAGTPEGRYTPHSGQVHPLGRYTPQAGTPQAGTPPGTSVCWAIWATSGRYATYWNAFL